MANRKRHKSTLARAEKIKAITALHYEAGNQSKCYAAVWRRWIEPEFRIGYRTFQRYMGLTREDTGDDSAPVLPGLFD